MSICLNIILYQVTYNYSQETAYLGERKLVSIPDRA